MQPEVGTTTIQETILGLACINKLNKTSLLMLPTKPLVEPPARAEENDTSQLTSTNDEAHYTSLIYSKGLMLVQLL